MTARSVGRAKRVPERREAADSQDEIEQRDAALVDHQQVGRQQELWFSHDFAPGAPFFLPSGAHIYNKLIELCRSACRKHGYQEVISPQML